jgi:hypothetical protein
MNKYPAYGRFIFQWGKATKRGISFHFTFEEWVEWWEANLGPDWLKKRGRKRGQYVMGRNGDKGPYAKWNVKCITTERNCVGSPKGQKKNAKPRKISAEDVKAIFYAKGKKAHIAVAYGVSNRLVSLIKSKEARFSITKDL